MDSPPPSCGTCRNHNFKVAQAPTAAARLNFIFRSTPGGYYVVVPTLLVSIPSHSILCPPTHSPIQFHSPNHSKYIYIYIKQLAWLLPQVSPLAGTLASSCHHVTRSPIFKLGKTTASPVFKTKRTTGSASVHFLVHYLSPLAALLPDADDAAW